MRKYILLQLFLLIAICGMAQSNDQALTDFNNARLKKTRTGMLILGGWALSNVLVSPVLARRSDGVTKHFYQMNAYWNIVNLGIAAAGYLNTLNQDINSMTLTASISEQQSIEKVLLFNTGLDVAYIMGGFYMMERARRGGGQSDRLKGFGRSIVLQGGFLFAFDLLFYLNMNAHGKGFHKLMSHVAMTPNGLGLTFVF